METIIDKKVSNIHQCEKCPYATSQQRKLKEHVENIHDKIKNFQCDQCQYASYREKALSFHVRMVHEGIRDFECNQCGYKAPFKGRLTHHIKTVHEGLRRHKCEKCSYSAKEKYCLKKHVSAVHDKDDNVPFKCDICLKAFAWADSLKHHTKVVHAKVKKFDCKLCPYKAAEATRLKVHVARMHEANRPFKCSECSFATKLKANLKHHTFRVHQKIRNHKCNQCDYASYCSKELKKHIIKKHISSNSECTNRNFVCKMCDYKGKLNGNLTDHVICVHFKLKPRKCDECLFATYKLAKLKQHWEKIHSESKISENLFFKYTCDQCFSTSERLSELLLHIKKEHPNRPLLCSKCKYSAACEEKVQEHFEKKHNKVGEKIKASLSDMCTEVVSDKCKGADERKFECTKCEFTTTNLSKVKKHFVRVHQTGLRYTCPNCPYAAKRKGNIKQHVEAVHNKIRNFKCQLCDFTSYCKGSLNQHLKKHSENRDFSCQMCDFIAKYNGSLTEHVLFRHLKILPKKCKECSWAGRKPGRLATHLINSHKVPKESANLSSKDNFCDQCTFFSKSLAELRSHLRKMHPGRPYICDKCEFSATKMEDVRKHFENICNKTPAKRSSVESKINTKRSRNYKIDVGLTKFDEFAKPCKSKIVCKSGGKVVRSTGKKNKSFSGGYANNNLGERSVPMIDDTNIKEENILGDDKSSSSGNSKDCVNGYLCAHCNRLYKRKNALKAHVKLFHGWDWNSDDDEIKDNDISDNLNNQVSMLHDQSSKFPEQLFSIKSEPEHSYTQTIKLEPVYEEFEVVSTELEDRDEVGINLCMPNHYQNLQKLCRLCASNTESDIQIIDIYPELIILNNFNVFEEDPNIHPKKLCEQCYRKCKAGEIVPVFEFKPHSEECQICV